MPTLEGWRGGSENDWDFLKTSAHHRHVARVIARGRFLLEAAFVFFINDNEPQFPGGREHGTARADHYLHLTARHSSPMPTALGAAQMTVQHRHAPASGLKPLNCLRRQTNLRYQNQNFFPLPNDL